MRKYTRADVEAFNSHFTSDDPLYYFIEWASSTLAYAALSTLDNPGEVAQEVAMDIAVKSVIPLMQSLETVCGTAFPALANLSSQPKRRRMVRWVIRYAQAIVNRRQRLQNP